MKVEATRAISVTGSSNSVTWKRGHGKSKPKISRTGMDNKVTQEKESPDRIQKPSNLTRGDPISIPGKTGYIGRSA
ncbi:DUF3060 domain-containing protein [Corallococcus sp. CA041A]|uniref:DUF3060 domain-containing protein n=1 Tax=Corallococcus sp. CA041A TaxID=2316727 RepID=UPI000EA035DB|nr:DUF3060 domain-containing protein [Corallococcus sp. CA041A]RKH22087.1 DUF3060 domain-containing protein [Corallococcus sp. CA041A]